MGSNERKKRSTKVVPTKEAKRPGPKKIKRKKTAIKKRNTARSRAKYPGLEKRFFSKAKQEAHDIDYINKLNNEEKLWLNVFMEEYLGARMNHEYENLHETDEEKRKVYRLNNSRNRDVMTVFNRVSSSVLDFLEEEDPINPEDQLIDLIDIKRREES